MKPKEVVRKELIARRRALPPDIRAQASARITDALMQRPEVVRAATLCVYESLPGEVDTKELWKRLHAEGKTVMPPAADPADMRGATIDVCIVPGVAFDRQGNRLGRGAGYYDRLLASVHTFTIGIAFDVQILSRLPQERYDIPMNVVMTEQATYG